MTHIGRDGLNIIKTCDFKPAIPDIRAYGLRTFLRNVRKKITGLLIDYNSSIQPIQKTQIYYGIREKIFRRGSKRKLFAELGLAAARDPKAFVKSLTRQNIKKFFAQYRILEASVIESKVRMKTSLHSKKGESAARVIDQAAFAGKQVAFCDNEEILMPPEEENRILVIDRSVPAYDKDSGALRMYSFLEILSSHGYRITFLPDDLLSTEPYTGDLQRLGIEVLNGNNNIENYMKKNGGVFSFVIISRAEQTYKYIALMRAYAIHSRIIYDTVDLHWMRFERTGAVTGKRDFLKMAKEYKAMELFNAMSADVTFTVTKDEKEILEREIPGVKVEVLPNIHRISKGETPFAARRDLMFIGGFVHQPNEDAVFYFVKEILPLIKEKLGEVNFFIVGSDPSSALLSLSSPDIIVTGYVKDVSPYFDNCRVFVSPLRYGAGMKGKIGQSMSYGLPVVTTTIGAEGIGLVDGENALVADNPEAFADAVVRLYKDEMLWNNIARKSLEHISMNYSREALTKKIGDLFDTLRTTEGGAHELHS